MPFMHKVWKHTRQNASAQDYIPGKIPTFQVGKPARETVVNKFRIEVTLGEKKERKQEARHRKLQGLCNILFLGGKKKTQTQDGNVQRGGRWDGYMRGCRFVSLYAAC